MLRVTFEEEGPARHRVVHALERTGPQNKRWRRFRTMAYIVHRQPKRKSGHRPQRLLYRSGITRDELVRLIEEVGREPVEAVLRAFDLPIEPALIPAE